MKLKPVDVREISHYDWRMHGYDTRVKQMGIHNNIFIDVFQNVCFMFYVLFKRSFFL